MIEVKYIPNRLEKDGIISRQIPYKKGSSIGYYLKKFGDVPTKVDLEVYNVIYMGKAVESLDERPRNKTQIIVTPVMKDPISATFAAIGAFLTSQAVQTAIFVLTLGFSVYQAITAKSRLPSFGTSGAGLDEDSPTYGWDGISQTASEGVAVPVVYGEHRIGGNVINEYIRTDGDKNYLHQLTALCEGEIDSVSSVKVNGNPIANFDNVSTTLKQGTNSQTAINGFEDLHNLQSVNVQLTQNNAHIYTTVDSDVEGFEVHLNLATGLFQQNPNNGQINAWAVTYKVEYRVNPAGGWTDLGSTTINEKSRSAVRRVFRHVGLSPDKYDIRVTKTSSDQDFDHTGDLYFDKLDEIKTDNLTYPNTALHAVEVLATEQLQGQVPNITCLVKGKKVSIPQVMNGSVIVDWEDYYWDPATSQYKLLSDDTVLSWDGSTFYSAWSANPIWCMKDLMLNTRYGLGEYVDSTLIDDTLFEEMSKYCEEKVSDGNGGYEKRYRLDVVIDSLTSAIDLISQLTATFDAFPFYSEGTIKFKIDKPETVTQVFGMGNIVKDSFSQSWKSLKEIPNVIEVTFNDQDKDYEQETISVQDPSVYDVSGTQRRKQQIRIFCTRTSQAIRAGRYALNVAKYVDRIIKFRAGIDAIACQVGDRIDISHDVPQWGFSGRLGSGSHTVSKIFLDKDVTIEAGPTYEVVVRHGADVIETREVTNSPETTNELDITPPLSAVPAEGDVYAFGEEDILVKPFRIISMERLNTDEVEITAIEYDANVYDDSAVTLPETNYSALSTDIPLVTDFDITERAVDLADGTTISVIDCYWQKPDDTGNLNKYKGVKIYLSDDNGASWSYVGFSEGIKFTIFDNIDTATYYVKAVTVCQNGIEDVISNAPQDTITIVGAGKTPDIVSNFAYTWGDKLTLKWSPNTELSLAGYEIRKNDTNFGVDDSNLVYRGLATTIVLEPTTRSVGTYYIRAYNTSGTYSTTSASITPTNSAPSQPSNITADILFNVARIYWDDVADVDVQYYEVWKSDTNVWGGEEELVAKVSGRQVNLKGNPSRGGIVDSATSGGTLVDADLVGLPDDYFNGDKVLITSGANEGDEQVITDFDGTTGTITVAGWATAVPSAGDQFLIHDVAYIKVRGYDNYGEGTFSDPAPIQYEGIDGDYIEDNVITARKIYVECLSALSANLGCVTAGVVQGITFQTAAGGARIVMDGTSFRSYDAGCNLMFEVCDGDVIAKSMCMVDPSCADCYSYLSAGQWYFHDELCNCNPYVKRITGGVACTGDTICLCGWCNAPFIMVGINSLNSFDSGYAGQTQTWDIYHDTPVFYCNSATDYGYCFDVHASLVLAAATGSEVVKNAGFNSLVTTCANVCQSCVALKFQLWCNAACANYYYGTICYALCYRKQGDTIFCACCFSYVQPHGSVGQMQTTNTVCNTLIFPCGETWEICANQVSLGWTNSGFSSATINCFTCCRTINACAVNHNCWKCVCLNTSCYACLDCTYYSDTVTVAGTKPSNTFCTYVCFALNDHANCLYRWLCHCFGTGCGGICTRVSAHNGAGASLYANGSYLSALCCGVNVTCGPVTTNWSQACTCINMTACSDSAFNSFIICSCFRSCFNQCSIGLLRYQHCACAQVDWSAGGFVYHCYCTVSGGAADCQFKCLHSLTDTFATQTILDPTGCLNWLAVGYF